MSTPALLGKVPWYRRKAGSWQAMRSLSNRRLFTLYLAIFFLFSIFGPITNLTSFHRLPVLVIAGLGLVNASYSLLYPFILIRHPAPLVWIVGIVHGFMIGTLTHWVVTSHTVMQTPGPLLSLFFTGQSIWLLVMLSYSFFLAFIRKQATDAIRVQSELELAQGIQQTLVPPIASLGPLYEIYGVTRPSDRVGGDLVDLIPGRDGDIAYVADVAGHGLQAGILMGMLKAAARTALLEPTSAAERLPMLLDRLDCVLPAVKEQHMYAAFAALQLGPGGRVRHAIAGHPPVLHYCRAAGTFCELTLEQLPLGLLPGAQFFALELNIEPGDLLLIATDGILEASNAEDREFGTSGLRTCIEAHASAPLTELAATVLTAVGTWGKQQDDQTLLIVRCLALR